MRKSLLFLALICLLMTCTLLLISCAGDEECAHTFSSEWASDGTHHWHAATCEHTDERADGGEHDWDAGSVTLEPTQAEDGVRTYTCKVCQATKTEPITALGHVHTYADAVVAPTCTEAGYTHHTCACGYFYDDTPTPATDHAWEVGESNDNGTHQVVCAHDATHTATVDCQYASAVTLPTCTAPGYTTYTCGCGDWHRANETDPADHQFNLDEWKSDDAYHWHEATCEHTTVRDDYTTHSYTIFVSGTAATCDTDGYAIYACECGKQQTTKTQTQLGHNYGDFVETDRQMDDASCCKEIVTREATCGRCGDTKQSTDYEYSHDFYTEYEPGEHCTVTGTDAAKKATCQTTGVSHRHCANPECRYYVTAEKITEMPIDPEAHVWGEGVPGEGENANRITYTCTVCHTATKVKYVVAEGSTSTSVSKDDGVNEVEIGNTTITMNQAMKDNITSEQDSVDIEAGVIEADDPNRESIVEDLEGGQELLIAGKPIYRFTIGGGDVTFDKNGGKATITIRYTLGTNEDRNKIVILFIAQNKLVAMDATYWEDAGGYGYVTFETEHFSYYVPAPVEFEKLCELVGEHSADRHVVAPTCTTGGYTVCLRCGETIATEAPRGHKWVSETVANNTCVSNGTTHYACADCDAAYDVVIPATGHYFVMESHVSASCTSEGRSHMGCIYCDEAYVVTVPQLAHQYVSKTVASTCTERGYTQRTCMLCADVQTAYAVANGHTYGTTWEKAEEGHYHTCSTCGARGETVAHVPGAEATTEHAQICTVCEYAIAPQLTHTHTDMKHITAIAPNCTENGNFEYYVCNCGKWFADEAGTQLITDHTSVVRLATGHTHENIPYVAPGCTTAGNTAGVKCAICQKLLKGNISIAPIGHDYAQIVQRPTCTAGGYTTYTCVNCDEHTVGHTYVDNDTEPVGHRYTAVVTAPTCLTNGSITYTCAYCDEETDGHTHTVDGALALGHSFAAVWTTDGAQHWHACTRCDAKIDESEHIRDYASATELHGVSCTICARELESALEHIHSLSRAVEAITATCTTSGRRAYFACACGERFEDAACTILIADRTSVIIPATGHTRIPQPQIDATCYSTGLTAGYTCHCGYSGGRVEIPMTDHNFNTSIRYDESGHWHKCAMCDAIDEKQSHTFAERVTVPTCTTPGYTEFTCACGYNTVGAQTPSLGHDFGDAQCNSDGTHSRVCSRGSRHVQIENCSYQAQVTPPTCTEQGYTTYTCACTYSYVSDTVRPTGHAFGEWRKNHDKTHSRYCTNDPSHTQRELCTFESQVFAPTCEQDGYTEHTCVKCGFVYRSDSVRALGHAYGDWVSNGDYTHTRVCATDASHTQTEGCYCEPVVTPPTCTERGYTMYVCKCGYSYVSELEYVNATGHSHGDWTPNGDGTHTRICANDASHTESADCTYEDGVCTGCGDLAEPVYGTNTILLETVYDEMKSCYYVKVSVKNADLAGIRFTLCFGDYEYVEALCPDTAAYHQSGNSVSVVLSQGENFVLEDLYVFSLYLSAGDAQPDAAGCTLSVLEIYRFAENGELVVPTYTVFDAQ